MTDPTLYLFDGNNLLHASHLETREELADALASFVALRAARGVLVFDGVGVERSIGALEVRFAAHADELIERLAAASRERESVAVVSSDRAITLTTGQSVRHQSAVSFLQELDAPRRVPQSDPQARLQIEARLDPETRARLEDIRRRR